MFSFLFTTKINKLKQEFSFLFVSFIFFFVLRFVSKDIIYLKDSSSLGFIGNCIYQQDIWFSLLNIATAVVRPKSRWVNYIIVVGVYYYRVCQKDRRDDLNLDVIFVYIFMNYK